MRSLRAIVVALLAQSALAYPRTPLDGSALYVPCPAARRKTALADTVNSLIDDAASTAPKLLRPVRPNARVPSHARANSLVESIKRVAHGLSPKGRREFAGPLLRFAFHDALSFNMSANALGGADGKTNNQATERSAIDEMRYLLKDCLTDYAFHPPEPIDRPYVGNDGHASPSNCTELAYSSTHGLATAQIIAEEWCGPYEEVSWADCYSVAASVLLEAVGGPPLDLTRFRWGRRDWLEGEPDPDADVGRSTPEKNHGFDALYNIFVNHYGFTVAEMVALGGAHTIGKHFSKLANAPGTFDETPHIFDNRYFQRVVNAKHRGVQQYAVWEKTGNGGGMSGGGMLLEMYVWRDAPYEVAANQTPSSTTPCGDQTDWRFVQGTWVPLYPESDAGSLILFNSDVAYYWNVSDPGCSAGLGLPAKDTPHGEASRWFGRFAQDEPLFKQVFGTAWLKMLELGNDPAKLSAAGAI